MFNFLPKDHKFFDELDTLARVVVYSSEQLSAVIATFPKLDGPLKEIELQRKKGRDLAQDSLARLDEAFITPLDREDILSLITGMNSVVELIDELAQRFRLYPLENLYPNLSDQSRNLLELAIQVEQIMAALRKSATLTDLAADNLQKVREIEDRVRRDREKFLSELFAGKPDPVDLIKKKELHGLLEEAIFSLIQVTQTLARVLLKNA